MAISSKRRRRMDVDVEVGPHQAIIEGIVVRRPRRMSPSQWLRFWEARSDCTVVGEYEKGYRAGYAANKSNWLGHS
jgi:hypothetical protein